MKEGDAGRIADVARLYLVVHGRPPDPGGLAAYVGALRGGKTLLQLAAEFVAADEFTRRVRPEDAVAALCRNAFGPAWDGAPPPGCGTAAELAAALVVSPAVQRRLPLLPALYPEGVPLRDASAYRMWLARQPAAPLEAPDAAGPALSVIILLGRPNPRWLEAMLASALDLPGVEVLVVPWGRPPAPMARRAAEARLRVVRARPWCGAAARFNRALACCTGAFTGLVGQHDLLWPAALATLSAAVDIALSDDDALDADGLRHSPRLGAAWDPDLATAAGRPGLVLVRTALLRQVGGMRRGEGETLLRAAAVPGCRIAHTPGVTLSRRGPVAPRRARRADQAAALERLAAAGQAGCAASRAGGVLRVIYPLPKTPPRASVIVPTRDRADLLRACLDGVLRRTAYPDIEVVVVDNGSAAPDALALLRELSQDRRVRVLAQPGPFNWAALNNAGVGAMSGTVAVLLNNDTEVIEPGWLRELASQALRPGVGAVGAKLLYPNRTVQHAGIVLGPDAQGTHMWRHAPERDPGYLGLLAATREAAAVTGACLALRRDTYLAAGGCDAAHLAVTWNDVDLCLRVRALGLRVIWTPHARLLHREQATRGTDDTPEHQARFKRERDWMRARWGAALDADPFLSPFLRPSEADPEPRLVAR